MRGPGNGSQRCMGANANAQQKPPMEQAFRGETEHQSWMGDELVMHWAICPRTGQMSMLSRPSQISHGTSSLVVCDSRSPYCHGDFVRI